MDETIQHHTTSERVRPRQLAHVKLLAMHTELCRRPCHEHSSSAIDLIEPSDPGPFSTRPFSPSVFGCFCMFLPTHQVFFLLPPSRRGWELPTRAIARQLRHSQVQAAVHELGLGALPGPEKHHE
ncbi:unnamed protein product [Durusdinium trenchii]|uniref:Uncharacterized protein n=1 Tax=Durusdinium trenchii TaxID=1381693 RepID=A0ABP0NYG7_9DINO